MKTTLKTILLFLAMVWGPNAFAQHASIKWLNMTELQEAMKKEPKKILIDVHTKWCGPCKMMMSNTFTDPKVIEYINKYYYAVSFNAEGNEVVNFMGNTYKNPSYNPAKANSRNGTHDFTKAIAPVNGRIAYPTIVYMDEDYTVLSPVQGYLKPNDIMPILSYFGSNSYKSTDWTKFQAAYGKK